MKAVKSIAIVLALLLAVAVAAGCGSSGDQNSAGSAGASAVGGSGSGNTGGSSGGNSNQDGGANTGADSEKPLDFPKKPITLIVPYAAGGATDTVGRVIAESVPPYLGQPMTVVNRAGASGTIGTEEGAKAAPDGYTIALTTATTLTVQPHLKQLNYTNADFRHLTSIVYNPLLLVVSEKSPYSTVRDIAEKAQGASLKVGHPGVGTVNDLAHVALFGTLGIEAVYVPFQSNNETIAAILGGHVDMAAVHPAEAQEFIKNNQLKVIGVFTPERLDQFPDYPTIAEGMAEAGIDFMFKDHDFSAWYYLSMPKDVPDDIFDFLVVNLTQLLNDPDFLEKTKKMNIIIHPIAGDDLVQQLENIEKYNMEILKMAEQVQGR